jgi:hypothetical protein
MALNSPCCSNGWAVAGQLQSVVRIAPKSASVPIGRATRIQTGSSRLVRPRLTRFLLAYPAPTDPARIARFIRNQVATRDYTLTRLEHEGAASASSKGLLLSCLLRLRIVSMG